MIRYPFGDPPLSRRITGFIALTVGTDGDRSSIGNPSFPRPGPRRNLGPLPQERCPFAGTRASARRRT